MQRALLVAALLALASAVLLLADADRAVFFAINGAMSNWPVPLLAALSLLGLGLYAVLAFTPALVLAPQVFGAAVLAAPVAGLLAQGGKELFDAPRPLAVLDPSQVHVVGEVIKGTTSLPSGHAITAGTCMTILLLSVPAARRTLATSAAILVLGALLMVSRIGVGAHWPSDVLLGAALGVVAGCVGVALARRWTFHQRTGGQWALAVIAAACAASGPFMTIDVPAEAWLLKYALSALGAASVLLWLRRRFGARGRA